MFKTPERQQQRRPGGGRRRTRDRLSEGLSPTPPTKLPGSNSSSKTSRRSIASTSTVSPPEDQNSSDSKKKNVIIVYLIRHGESIGQTKSVSQRRTDMSLKDCDLTELGKQQAKQISHVLSGHNIDLVVSSPLLRALHTACIAFPSDQQRQILVHYHLREIGSSRIPENTPRNMSETVQMLGTDFANMIDYTTLQPPDRYPDCLDAIPKVVQRDRVREALFFLGQSMLDNGNQSSMAVVCHYHTIRAALGQHNMEANQPRVSPDNASIYKCELCMDTGQLTLIEELGVNDNHAS